MIWLGILIGAIALAVLEAIVAIVLYIVWLRRHTRGGEADDAVHNVSIPLADWADDRLTHAGITGLKVSRKYAALRSRSHIAFWGAEPNESLRIGFTFVTRDDVEFLNEHAPAPKETR